MKIFATRLTFEDRISPMLLKELRQELRTKTFTALFITAQATLALSFLFNYLSSDLAGHGVRDFFYWVVLVVPLCLVFPRECAFGFKKEVQTKSLELLYLTRLNGLKLVIGKWLTGAFLSALYVVSITPYAVFRYLQGGVNLVEELKIAGWLLWTSVTLAAVGLGIFGNSKPKRIGFWITIITVLVGIPAGISLIEFVFRGRASGLDEVVTLVYTALLAAIMLTVAAGKVGSQGESYALPQRALGLISLALIPLLHAFGVNESWTLFCSLILLSILFIYILLEPTPVFWSELEPLLKRGSAARRLGILFYPGWANGLLYIALSSALLLCFSSVSSTGTDLQKFLILLLGAILMPAALIKLIAPRRQITFASYLLVHLLIFLLPFFFYAGSNYRNAVAAGSGGSFFPSFALFAIISRFGPGTSSADWQLSLVSLGLSFLILLYRARTELRLVHKLEQEALNQELRRAAAQGESDVQA